jgi:hypothetical protein
MSDIFLNGDGLINNGLYKDAFSHFSKALHENTTQSLSKEDMSDIYNYLGVLVLFDPSLSSIDECGISFYIKSLECNPDNISARLNIITNYGAPSPPNHNNKSAFQESMNYFMTKLSSCDDHIKDIVMGKINLYEKL